MALMPSIAIFVHAGDANPVVLSTAGSRHERELLAGWLETHPALARLVRIASELAESSEDGGGAEASR